MSTEVAKPLAVQQHLHASIMDLQAAARQYDELEVSQFAARCRQIAVDVRQVLEADEQRTGQ